MLDFKFCSDPNNPLAIVPEGKWEEFKAWLVKEGVTVPDEKDESGKPKVDWKAVDESFGIVFDPFG